MVKTAVLVSGGGTNLQAIIDAKERGEIKNCELTVISSRPDAYALTRAENHGIPAYVVNRKQYGSRESFSAAMYEKLRELGAELVVLAGFMYILGEKVTREYKNRIINIHAALLPSFGGEGFYGLRVHRAVLDYGVKLTGATAHFADGGVDSGPIILQRAVEVREGDTPQSLQRRIMEEAEWKILPEAISLFCEGRLRVDGRIVHII